MNRSRLLALPLAALLLLLASAPASAVYHPTLGRFLQRDPIGYADGMSLYEYVASAPLARVDPLGLYMPGDPTTGALPYSLPPEITTMAPPLTMTGALPRKTAGAAAFAGAAAKMKDLCQKCCCPESIKQCKQEGQAIADAIAAVWNEKFDIGKEVEDRAEGSDPIGGQLCYEWAKDFADAARRVEPQKWEVTNVAVDMGRVEPNLIHQFTQLYACPGEHNRDKKAECLLMMDDGYMDGGYVHDYPWPPPKYPRRTPHPGTE